MHNNFPWSFNAIRMTNMMSTLRQGSMGFYKKTSNYLSFLLRSFSGNHEIEYKGRSRSSLPSSRSSSCTSISSSMSCSSGSDDLDNLKYQLKNFDGLYLSSDLPLFKDEAPTGPPSRTESNCSCFSCTAHQDVPEIRNFNRQKRPSMIITDNAVRDFYEVLEVLGEGSFSTVYLAESIKVRGGFAAIKVVQKSDLIKTKRIPLVKDSDASNFDERSDEEYVDEIEDLTWLIDREIRVMYELDHPHIIRLDRVFEDHEVACFVMELAKGGEVFDRLVEHISFDELPAADLIVQILCAVQHIHDQGIVHRDLKLENLLYYDDSVDSKIMVADFGLSDWESNLQAGSPVCGTPSYLAPEVIARNPCTTKSDVWAIGVITYLLLAGYPPFYADHEEDSEEEDAVVLKRILKCQYEFHERAWGHISKEGKDFVKTLLNPDPEERPSCEEALKHHWIKDRHVLEQKRKRDQRKRKKEFETSRWTVLQVFSFMFSILVLLVSYTLSVLYIMKIDTGLMSFLPIQIFDEKGLGGIINKLSEFCDPYWKGLIEDLVIGGKRTTNS